MEWAKTASLARVRVTMARLAAREISVARRPLDALILIPMLRIVAVADALAPPDSFAPAQLQSHRNAAVMQIWTAMRARMGRAWPAGNACAGQCNATSANDACPMEPAANL